MHNNNNSSLKKNTESTEEVNQLSMNSPQKNTLSGLFFVYLKGILMGMADIVPGVSGGTIALIAGIYHRLISSISSFDFKLLSLWRQQGLVNGFVAVWKQVDATFLLCLLCGIVTSIVTMAGYISHLLEHEPLKIWSLFFGLVIATVFILLVEIKRWTWQRVMLFVVGTVIAIGISQLPIVSGTPSLPHLFFAGSIAICAMILPGVSGSFILVLLGAYQAVLDAVHDKDITTLATVVAGMVTGLLVFSKFLKWLLNNYYQATLALLTGFIAGSLVKIYPWKVTVNNSDAVHGVEGATEVVINVLPSAYPAGAQLPMALFLMVIGASIVLLLAWVGKTFDNNDA